MGRRTNKSEIHASFNIIRVGQRYRLTNYGDIYTFEVLEIINSEKYSVRSLDTLETYNLEDIVRFGKGEDFYFEEI